MTKLYSSKWALDKIVDISQGIPTFSLASFIFPFNHVSCNCLAKVDRLNSGQSEDGNSDFYLLMLRKYMFYLIKREVKNV